MSHEADHGKNGNRKLPLPVVLAKVGAHSYEMRSTSCAIADVEPTPANPASVAYQQGYAQVLANHTSRGDGGKRTAAFLRLTSENFCSSLMGLGTGLALERQTTLRPYISGLC